MAFVGKILILTLISMPSCFALIQTKLKELATKQNVYNLRYFTDKGKYSYYQNLNGDLILSLNYKVKIVNKGKKNDQYYINESNSGKYLTIEHSTHYLKSNSVIKDNLIYLSKVGAEQLTFVGNGTTPKIHLQDTYLTYFNLKDRRIFIKDLKHKNLEWSVLIGKKINPYFIPTIEMIDTSNILFTTLDKKGFQSILKYNLHSKKFKIIFKLDSQKQKIESCKTNKEIIFGVFSFSDYRNSKIYKYNKKMKFDEIYTSKSDDLGNLICLNNSKLYFIKKEYINNKQYTDAYILMLDQKNMISKKTDLKYLRQISKNGKTIIASFHSRFFVVDGFNDLTIFDKITQ